MNGKGIEKIHIQSSTESMHWNFQLSNKSVTVYFGIKRKYTYDESPLQLQSAIYMEFDPTEDYDFITRLFVIGRNFIRYICYRRNINITASNVYAHDENRRIWLIGSFDANWLHTAYPEAKKQIKKCFIPISLLEDSLEFLFQHLAEDTLYLRHVPENYSASKGMTPAHSIMLTAAFEWEFSQLYPDGVKHKEKTLTKRELIKKGLD